MAVLRKFQLRISQQMNRTSQQGGGMAGCFAEIVVTEESTPIKLKASYDKNRSVYPAKELSSQLSDSIMKWPSLKLKLSS